MKIAEQDTTDDVSVGVRTLLNKGHEVCKDRWKINYTYSAFISKSYRIMICIHCFIK
jgi:hypothetical protein